MNMIEIVPNLEKVRRWIWLVLPLLILICLLPENVIGLRTYSMQSRNYAAVTSPSVILQNGTVDKETIYTNLTGAMVSVNSSGWGSWSSELLVNPGFEVGNLDGWTAKGPASATVSVFNATFGGDQYTNRNLRIGSYGVCTNDTPGTDDDSGVWQNVSVAAYASAIDAGNAVINASAWLYPSEWAWDDCALIVRFYKSGGSFTSAWNTTGEYGQGTAYHPKAWMLGSGKSHFTQGVLKKFGCYNYPVPTGTRTVGIQLGMGEYQSPGYCGGQADEASIKIRTGPSHDYVLRIASQIADNRSVSLQVYSSSNIGRLSGTTISFRDGTSNTQIIVSNGGITKSAGSFYNLVGNAIIYIKMSGVLATTSGTSNIYVYLKVLKPSTTTYGLFTIAFTIT